MRYDCTSYIIAVLCFVLGTLLFMDYAQYIELTTGNEVTDLIIMMFSAILGLVFVGLGYAVRPKKPTPAPLPAPIPSTPPKLTEAESKKRKLENGAQKRKLNRTPLYDYLKLFFKGF